jgi:hypothetical protein
MHEFIHRKYGSNLSRDRASYRTALTWAQGGWPNRRHQWTASDLSSDDDEYTEKTKALDSGLRRNDGVSARGLMIVASGQLEILCLLFSSS